jgi:radical SAM superfamily enzyme with C-terminal helix-hairpin-helix motif
MNNIANEIYQAIVKHTAWKKRLHQVIDTGKKGQDVGIEHCELGKWLKEHAAQLGSYQHYSIVVDLHNKLHKEADQIVNLASRGRTTEAKTAIEYGSEFEHLSQDLVRNIIAWHDVVTKK